MKSKLVMFIAVILMAASCTSRTYVSNRSRPGYNNRYGHRDYGHRDYDHNRYDRRNW